MLGFLLQSILKQGFTNLLKMKLQSSVDHDRFVGVATSARTAKIFPHLGMFRRPSDPLEDIVQVRGRSSSRVNILHFILLHWAMPSYYNNA